MLTINFDELRFTNLIRSVVKEELELIQSISKSAPTSGRLLYNLDELAKFLKCSKPTAQKLKNEGKIPYKKMGHKFIYECDEIMKATEYVGNKNKKKA